MLYPLSYGRAAYGRVMSIACRTSQGDPGVQQAYMAETVGFEPTEEL